MLDYELHDAEDTLLLMQDLRFNSKRRASGSDDRRTLLMGIGFTESFDHHVNLHQQKEAFDRTENHVITAARSYAEHYRQKSEVKKLVQKVVKEDHLFVQHPHRPCVEPESSSSDEEEDDDENNEQDAAASHPSTGAPEKKKKKHAMGFGSGLKRMLSMPGKKAAGAKGKGKNLQLVPELETLSGDAISQTTAAHSGGSKLPQRQSSLRFVSPFASHNGAADVPAASADAAAELPVNIVDTSLAQEEIKETNTEQQLAASLHQPTLSELFDLIDETCLNPHTVEDEEISGIIRRASASLEQLDSIVASTDVQESVGESGQDGASYADSVVPSSALAHQVAVPECAASSPEADGQLVATLPVEPVEQIQELAQDSHQPAKTPKAKQLSTPFSTSNYAQAAVAEQPQPSINSNNLSSSVRRDPPASNDSVSLQTTAEAPNGNAKPPLQRHQVLSTFFLTAEMQGPPPLPGTFRLQGKRLSGTQVFAGGAQVAVNNSEPLPVIQQGLQRLPPSPLLIITSGHSKQADNSGQNRNTTTAPTHAFDTVSGVAGTVYQGSDLTSLDMNKPNHFPITCETHGAGTTAALPFSSSSPSLLGREYRPLPPPGSRSGSFRSDRGPSSTGDVPTSNGNSGAESFIATGAGITHKAAAAAHGRASATRRLTGSDETGVKPSHLSRSALVPTMIPSHSFTSGQRLSPIQQHPLRLSLANGSSSNLARLGQTPSDLGGDDDAAGQQERSSLPILPSVRKQLTGRNAGLLTPSDVVLERVGSHATKHHHDRTSAPSPVQALAAVRTRGRLASGVVMKGSKPEYPLLGLIRYSDMLQDVSESGKVCSVLSLSGSRLL